MQRVSLSDVYSLRQASGKQIGNARWTTKFLPKQKKEPPTYIIQSESKRLTMQLQGGSHLKLSQAINRYKKMQDRNYMA